MLADKNKELWYPWQAHLASLYVPECENPALDLYSVGTRSVYRLCPLGGYDSTSAQRRLQPVTASGNIKTVVCFFPASSLKMEVTYWLEMSVDFQRAARLFIFECCILLRMLLQFSWGQSIADAFFECFLLLLHTHYRLNIYTLVLPKDLFFLQRARCSHFDYKFCIYYMYTLVSLAIFRRCLYVCSRYDSLLLLLHFNIKLLH
jgi:hypothetical protein